MLVGRAAGMVSGRWLVRPSLRSMGTSAVAVITTASSESSAAVSFRERRRRRPYELTRPRQRACEQSFVSPGDARFG